MRIWIDRIHACAVLIGLSIQELWRGTTLIELTNCLNEMADNAEDPDFQPHLYRAIRRGHGDYLRQQCDPRSGRCLKCTAVSRVLVKTYLGAPTPPAGGSTWYPGDHAEEVDAELAAIGGAGASCESCGPVREQSQRRCCGGSCGIPAATA
jgi:hypothetical protein